MSRAVVVSLLVLAACKRQPDAVPQETTAVQPAARAAATQPSTQPQAPAPPAAAAAPASADDEPSPDPEPAAAAGQPAAYCAHIERCGCPMDACLDTMAGMIASPPVHDLASCVTQLPCEAACSDAADRSSAKYTQCVAPIQAALQERGRSIESIRAMTRNVIDSYPGSTRVKNFDETGRYLGESQR